MISKIQKWRNGLGLRIPNAFARGMGVKEGSAVDVAFDGDGIVVRPVPVFKYQLRDLLSDIRKENLHAEMPIGDPVGREDSGQ